MDFTDTKQVGKRAIPVGAIGGFLLILAITTSTTWLLIVAILLVIVSGAMWTMHGIAEDRE